MARQEIRFFLSNYIVCWAETVAKPVMQRRYLQNIGLNIWLRLLGYAWVFSFFFCTVPALKYPLVYEPVRG
ncbi:hypothetical protein F4781DRAFT_410266 [Annulohypoxylon bovei var. microspora]|nr:hypothetical protein F4781DRAFT_410266 [Annulohypoxylon bovei var. microspora]